MANQYLDFELELGMADSSGAWPLSVIASPAGNARGQLTLPDAPETIALRAQAADPAIGQVIGKMLFDRLLLNSGVYGPYAEGLGYADAHGKGLRVKLRVVDPRLALVPWELLYEQRFGEFVALSQETPVVRYAEAAQPDQPLTVKPPLRILGMVVSPSDLAPIDVAAQKQVVEDAVASLIKRGLVELVWLEGGGWRDLQRAMRGADGAWHIFHFVGHGAVNPAGGEGVLAFGGEGGQAHLLAAAELGRILAVHAPLRLVLLNACQSATASAANLYTSAAATLIRRGVPAVIAMQFMLLEKAGVEFARTFYEAVADGMPVEAALTDARIAVSLDQNRRLDWAAPVLYLRAPDGILFQIEQHTPLGSPSITPVPIVAAVPALPADAESPLKLAKPVITLSGAQQGKLQSALVSAFTEDTLRQMVRVRMDETLDVVAGGANLNSIVFNLLEWARRTNRIAELIEGAINEVPSNAQLQEFVKTLL